MTTATDNEVREYLADRGMAGDFSPGSQAFELARAVVEMQKAREQAFDAWAQLKPIKIKVRRLSPEYRAETELAGEGR